MGVTIELCVKLIGPFSSFLKDMCLFQVMSDFLWNFKDNFLHLPCQPKTRRQDLFHIISNRCGSVNISMLYILFYFLFIVLVFS